MRKQQLIVVHLLNHLRMLIDLRIPLTFVLVKTKHVNVLRVLLELALRVRAALLMTVDKALQENFCISISILPELDDLEEKFYLPRYIISRLIAIAHQHHLITTGVSAEYD